MGKGKLKWLTIALIGAVILLAARCQQGEVESDHESQTTYLNHNDTVGYVGIETCKQCHYDIYQTFVQTGMGSSFGQADTSKSIAELNGQQLFDAYHNLGYYPHWKGDSLRLLEFRLEQGDTTFKKEETIDYVVGSGQHTNSHIYEHAGYLFQAPFTWYSQRSKLDLPPGYEDGANSRFDRKIGLECTSCHNAMPTGFVKGSINMYAKVPSAINCERCHGPGELHVQRMMAGEFVDTAKDIDYSIVNLGKLSPDLQFETCQRCHLQGNAVLAEGKSFFDFKPGMRLNSVMDIYLPRYSNAEDEFIMASHVDRFKQSKCYLNKSEEFNCTSCHNPHISVRNTNIENFNKSCADCHEGSPTLGCNEQLSELQAKDFNCVGCHMPMSSSVDIPHVTVHDHRIAIPRGRKDTAGLKEFLGLAAINNPSPTVRSKAKAYLQQYERFDAQSYHLDSAKVFLDRLGKGIDQLALWTHYYFLRRDMKSLITVVQSFGETKVLEMLDETTYDNEEAWTAYRIGEAFSDQTRPNALDFYRKAVELAPHIADFKNKYATSQFALDQVEEAISTFTDLLKERPKHKEALNNLGFIYLQQGRVELASLYIERALAEDPDYEKAWLNMASLYLVRENKTEALKAVNEVLRINPNNQKAVSAREYLLGS